MPYFDNILVTVERDKKCGLSGIGEIKSVMKEYNDSYDMYCELFIISMPSWEMISKASNYVHTNRKTFERWVKNYNEKIHIHKILDSA